MSNFSVQSRAELVVELMQIPQEVEQVICNEPRQRAVILFCHCMPGSGLYAEQWDVCRVACCMMSSVMSCILLHDELHATGLLSSMLCIIA